ncbi:anthranilate synthase component I family protein [Agromyces sp. MMS24-K17]|uniref:anthranilate synthase component I family protein n=1 Tax=Agromyces sp. MMS24-K17 TaxID=3372850 RepID=UPI003754F81E
MPRRVHVRVLPEWRDPEAVFRRFGADAPVVAWLDGGPSATAGRSVLVVGDAESRVLVSAPDAGDPDDVLRGLRRGLSDLGADASADEASAPGPAAAAPAVLGWIGWFGYEWGAARLGVPVAPTDAPGAAFLLAERAIVWEHATGAMALHWLDGPAGEAWATSIAAGLAVLVDEEAPAAEASVQPEASLQPEASVPPDASVPGASEPPAPRVRWRDDPAAYRRKIEACRAAIVRGDAYQLCLTNRVEVDGEVDAVAAYLRLRRSSPTHHGGFLRLGGVALLSASPEQFLVVDRDGTVTTKPMKGTRPRGADPASDAALRAELLASEKERAENLMIVDLMRNDLGRVAELGTVAVPALHEVEEYAHVHQLVSTVSARLRPPLDALDAVAAAFPAGSMTGAPKLSAMRILHDLEGGPRGVYSGAFGCLAVDGTADLAMTIRSVVVTSRGASIGTGGGITALSEADAEVEETRVKARALIDAVVGRRVAPIE